LRQSIIRHNWTFEETELLYELPFLDLLDKARTIHRRYLVPNYVQKSTLISIKTGACPEDCAYCPQSGHYNTGVQKEALMELDKVLALAQLAKGRGATRFCMGAAWRSPEAKNFSKVLILIQEVKKLGLETCVTLGMLSAAQAHALKEAGLDYYNHNLDTSPEYYKKIITTRSYQDRLDTLQKLREADIKVCCGGIIGMGESRTDRVNFLLQLANLPEHPESVPINRLTRVKGTPLCETKEIDSFEFIRTVAIARIMMPKAMIRLSCGRYAMSDEMQALCFLGGANSIHYGEEKLFITDNPSAEKDQKLLAKLGLTAELSL
jgi:biotin synthase